MVSVHNIYYYTRICVLYISIKKNNLILKSKQCSNQLSLYPFCLEHFTLEALNIII